LTREELLTCGRGGEWVSRSSRSELLRHRLRLRLLERLDEGSIGIEWHTWRELLLLLLWTGEHGRLFTFYRCEEIDHVLLFILWWAGYCGCRLLFRLLLCISRKRIKRIRRIRSTWSSLSGSTFCPLHRRTFAQRRNIRSPGTH